MSQKLAIVAVETNLIGRHVMPKEHGQWPFEGRTGFTGALLLVAGCSVMIGTKPPPQDWPSLAITERIAEPGEIDAKCGPYGMANFLNAGCALIDFRALTCTILHNRVRTQTLSEHERKHCLGWDHAGDSTLAELWMRWKATR